MKRLLLLALVVIVPACGSNSSSAPTTSTGLTTETFTGTVGVKGSDFKPFNVALTGEVDVTLTSVTPSIAMGVFVGTLSGSTCTAITGSTNNSVTPGSSAQVAGIVSPGSFCVQVFDSGNLTTSVTYGLTIVHP